MNSFNTLPPLPLIDGALFIDNSGFVEGINTCTRYLQYKVINGRISAGEKSSLNFGSAIHLALEHRYKNWQNREVDQQYYNDIGAMFDKFFAEHPPQSDDFRTMNWAMELVREYNNRYGIEEFSLLADKQTGKPWVELPFALGLCQIHPVTLKCLTWSGKKEELEPYFVGVCFTGKIDIVCSIDNNIYVLDHKTSEKIGNQFWDEYRMSSQPRGYAWAFQEITGIKPHGYIINCIRSKDKPQYVMKGKNYTREGKTTTPEQWWKDTYQRERFIIKHDQDELGEWKQNTIDLVEEFFWHYSRGYFPMKTKWCAIYGRCPYYDVCSLAKEDRGVMLASGMFQDNTWSPLNKNDALVQPTQPKQ